MSHLPPDLQSMVVAIELAVASKDSLRLAALVGLMTCLLERCREHLAMTVGGTVTPPPNSGRLLTVNEAAAKTGLRPSYFYRHAHELPCTRRPSPGRIRFDEAELISHFSKRGRLPT